MKLQPMPGRIRPHAPREPLYTLVEISYRVGIPAPSLRGYLSSIRTAAPVALTHTKCTRGVGHVAMYRLSEIRRWMQANQIESKYLTHARECSRDSAR